MPFLFTDSQVTVKGPGVAMIDRSQWEESRYLIDFYRQCGFQLKDKDAEKDSPPEAISIAVATIMLIGTALGASLALAIVVVGASYVGAQKWAAPRIGRTITP